MVDCHAKRLSRVVRLGQLLPRRVEYCRGASEFHAAALPRDPGRQRSLEVVAVHAGVAEHLHHLNSVVVRGLHRYRQWLIVHTGFVLLRVRSQSQGQQKDACHGFHTQVPHAETKKGGRATLSDTDHDQLVQAAQVICNRFDFPVVQIGCNVAHHRTVIVIRGAFTLAVGG